MKYVIIISYKKNTTAVVQAPRGNSLFGKLTASHILKVKATDTTATLQVHKYEYESRLDEADSQRVYA